MLSISSFSNSSSYSLTILLFYLGLGLPFSFILLLDLIALDFPYIFMDSDSIVLSYILSSNDIFPLLKANIPNINSKLFNAQSPLTI